jgi:hypothetical protein
MFQKDLGSLLDKAGRVEGLVRPLAAATGLEAAADVAVAATHLAKADLATSTVMEMTALAGTMGRHYALKQGLAPEVRGRGLGLQCWHACMCWWARQGRAGQHALRVGPAPAVR